MFSRDRLSAAFRFSMFVETEMNFEKSAGIRDPIENLSLHSKKFFSA